MPKYPNIFIFFGADAISLRQKVRTWEEEFRKKYTAQGIIRLDSENLSEKELGEQLATACSPSLFSQKKLIIARNFLPSKSSQEILIQALEKLLGSIPADYFLIFWQDALDRRLSFIKKLAKDANFKEFASIEAPELNTWIKTQAQILGVKIDDPAVEKLAQFCGRDLSEGGKAGFDIWHIYSELEKLGSLGRPITAADIEQLVVPVVSENAFKLSDAVFSQNKKQILEILERLFAEESGDEKFAGIRLLGLASDSARAKLAVNLLEQQNFSQDQIAQFLGWKNAGRVWMTLKGPAVTLEILKKLISRLQDADIRLKTSDADPKLLLELNLL
ncbi:MAG TPA: DNA polymerase III subunit delta [Patescibacteria group bacterium]|nr:DNA polymerase III subunit delta [Patescibacteria group bacterium]